MLHHATGEIEQLGALVARLLELTAAGHLDAATATVIQAGLAAALP
ncbi:hypothetical protein RZS08_04740 [Arthrospira platensis SPKY1]|nr:hypothetical protein [Arthrospira platensis SPKY1]